MEKDPSDPICTKWEEMLVVPGYIAYDFRGNCAKASDVSSFDHSELTVKMSYMLYQASWYRNNGVIISDVMDTATDGLGMHLGE